ncbi:MAG: cation acetate symporter [Zoogloea sp.]|nr:cation acetate symporter [Zoogloea sp.]
MWRERARRAAVFLLLAPPSAWAGEGGFSWLLPGFLGVMVAVMLGVSLRAATRVRSAADFYTAGGSLSGLQNGWALAGEYLSAASFLGLTGLIALWGYDGIMYAVGWLVAYVAVLLLIAEPCRNIGRYTLADILACRNDPTGSRVVAAMAGLTISILYLTAQLVGGGVLVRTLTGIDDSTAIVAVGVLMLSYVLIGGMLATTWVQIVKAGLLVCVSAVLVVIVCWPYGFSLPALLQAAVDNPGIQVRVAYLLGEAASGMAPQELGQRFLEPGLLFRNPVDQISLGLALVLGTAGLPHILMRFCTVGSAGEVRRSVIWAMGIVGAFYVLIFFIGLGAAITVGPDAILAADPGGNLAAPLLARLAGGGAGSFWGNFLFALVASVAFGTIVAVVAGLALSAASALAHDLYVGVFRDGRVSAVGEVRAARIATAVVGVVAILVGLSARGHNVAHLVALAFTVAASANFPCLLLTLYWTRCNTGGIIAGMTIGTLSSIALLLVSPNMTYPQAVKAEAQRVLQAAPAREAAIRKAVEGARGSGDPSQLAAQLKALADLDLQVGQARNKLHTYRNEETSLLGLERPLIDLQYPGLISIPLGFLAVFFGSLMVRDRRAEAMWDEINVRQNTGILAPGHATMGAVLPIAGSSRRDAAPPFDPDAETFDDDPDRV